jgi:hypothetical protein
MSPWLFVRFSVLLSTVGCIVVCPFPEPDPIVCTEIAVAAVTVQVVGADGSLSTDAVVTFRENGSSEAPCDRLDDGQFVCGWEVSGLIEVIARTEAGSASATIDVDHDGCHPIPEFVVLTLAEDAPCTEEAVPSVALEVVDPSGATLSSATARFSVDDETVLAPCDMWDGTLYCGIERTGEFTVLIEAEGHDPEVRVYDVVLDEAGCHPETVEDTVVLGTCEG